MNSAEILSASDGQLNEWCAIKVMEWELGYPDSYMKKACYLDANGNVASVRYLYNPTSNLTQSIALLDHLAQTKTSVHNWAVHTLSSPNWIQCNISGSTGEFWSVQHEHKTVTGAIVVASLLAIIKLEERKK